MSNAVHKAVDGRDGLDRLVEEVLTASAPCRRLAALDLGDHEVAQWSVTTYRRE